MKKPITHFVLILILLSPLVGFSQVPTSWYKTERRTTDYLNMSWTIDDNTNDDELGFFSWWYDRSKLLMYLSQETKNLVLPHGGVITNGIISTDNKLKINTGDGDKIQLTRLTAGSKIAHSIGWWVDYYAGPGNEAAVGGHRFYSTRNNAWQESLRITGAGKVGIGTTNPSESLHVAGSIKADGVILTDNKLKINTVNGDKIQLTSNTAGPKIAHSSGWWLDYYAGPGNQAAVGGHRFYSTRNNAWQESLRITGDGKVGIGTTSPSESLDVAGTIRTREGGINADGIISTNNKLKINTGDGDKIQLTSYTAGSKIAHSIGWWVDYYAGPGNEAAAVGGHRFYSTRNNEWQESLRITGSGKVGIGNASPEAMLHINGKVRAEDSGIKIDLSVNEAKTMGWIGTTTNHGLYIGTNSTGTNLYMDTDDNVFIGGNPSTSVTNLSKYDLFVETGVLSEDYALAPKASWADYVFKKDYELMALDQVEKYINEQGHLPEMPSASNVAKEGYNLHDMNIKFLSKIEELTLHTINQEKQLKTQQQEIKELKTMINTLIGKIK